MPAARHVSLEFRGHIRAEERPLSIISSSRVSEAMDLDENI